MEKYIAAALYQLPAEIPIMKPCTLNLVVIMRFSCGVNYVKIMVGIRYATFAHLGLNICIELRRKENMSKSKSHCAGTAV